jgi:hypothetical protein
MFADIRQIEEQLWRDQMSGATNQIKPRPQPDHAHTALLDLGWELSQQVGKSILYAHLERPGVRIHYRADRWYPYLVEGRVTATCHTPGEAHNASAPAAGDRPRLVLQVEPAGCSAGTRGAIGPVEGRRERLGSRY